MISFSCWSCNTPLTVPAHLAGVTGPCPRCGQTLAAPVAPPAFAPEPYSSPSTASSYGSGKASAAIPSGYRAPVAKPPPLPQDDDDLGWKLKLGSPLWAYVPLVMGLLGGLLGGLVGAGTVLVNRRLHRHIANPVARIFATMGVTASGFVVYLIAVCIIGFWLHPEQWKDLFNGGTVTAGSLVKPLAELRAKMQSMNPGMFNESDYIAAEAAVLKQPSHDVQHMQQVYLATLKDRLQNRPR